MPDRAPSLATITQSPSASATSNSLPRLPSDSALPSSCALGRHCVSPVVRYRTVVRADGGFVPLALLLS